MMKLKFCSLATIFSTIMFSSSFSYAAKIEKPINTELPYYTVDPFWPKSLPDGWITGQIAGTCVDAQNHLFIVTRGFQKNGLITSPTPSKLTEGVSGAPKSKPSPPVIEFDPEGNVINSWGDNAIVAS